MSFLHIISTLLLITYILGCSSDSYSPETSVSYNLCISDGGEVITEEYPDGTKSEFCSTKTSYQYDDGQQEYEELCLLEYYENDSCDRDAQDDKIPGLLLSSSSDSKTVYTRFHDTVLNIMTNISDTGYGHNAHNNFSLHPNYNELNGSHSDYDLFLDCS